MARDLDDDVRRGAKTIKAQPFARLEVRELQRAVANDAGAEQGRSFQVGEIPGERIGKGGGSHHRFRIAAVGMKAREPRPLAEVFQAFAAVYALPAGRIEPRNAHAVTLAKFVHARAQSVHRADDLMAGDYRKLGKRQIPFHDVQVRMANAAGAHAHADFPCGRIQAREARKAAADPPQPAAVFPAAWHA